MSNQTLPEMCARNFAGVKAPERKAIVTAKYVPLSGYCGSLDVSQAYWAQACYVGSCCSVCRCLPPARRVTPVSQIPIYSHSTCPAGATYLLLPTDFRPGPYPIAVPIQWGLSGLRREGREADYPWSVGSLPTSAWCGVCKQPQGRLDILTSNSWFIARGIKRSERKADY